MSFTDEQIAKLRADLPAAHVTAPTGNGPKQSYIKGWRAIDSANEIFGHGNWDVETLSLEMCQLETKPKRNDDSTELQYVGYLARVRVTVRHGDGTSTKRDNVGFGQGQDQDVGKSHESAAKEAVTDATKRALCSFGWPLGLALYDESSEHVEGGTATTKRPAARNSGGPRNSHVDQADGSAGAPAVPVKPIFGWTPPRPPYMKAFGSPPSDSQRKALARRAFEHPIAIKDTGVPWLLLALTLALGRDEKEYGSKGAHSVGMDFLALAMPASVELAMEDAVRLKQERGRLP